MNARIAATVTGASALILLTGCVAEVPEPVTEAPELEMKAALLEPQSDRIIEETHAEIEAADADEDTDLFGSRVGGPVVTVRDSQYTFANDGDGPAPDTLPAETQAVYTVGATDWPRTMAAVTEPAGEDSTPVIMMWVQDSIDDDYQLRQFSHMIPGAAIPAMNGTTEGAEQLSVTAEGLQMTPEDAIANYVDLLNNGSDSDYADTFAEDSYREQLFTTRETLSEAASEAGGEYEDTFEPDAEDTYVMSTAEGGALVFTYISVESSFSVDDGIVEISDAQEPLVDGDIEEVAIYDYLDSLVMYIPAEDSEEQPAVVAADRNLISISAE